MVLFGHVRNQNTAHLHKHIFLTVKHDGGSITLWRCSSAAGRLVKVETILLQDLSSSKTRT